MKNDLQILPGRSSIIVYSSTAAQNQPESGIVISEFGASYNIENPDPKISLTQVLLGMINR